MRKVKKYKANAFGDEFACLLIYPVYGMRETQAHYSWENDMIHRAIEYWDKEKRK